METLLKTGFLVLLGVLFFALGIGIFLRASYEVAIREVCDEAAVVNYDDVLQKIRTTNTSAEPFIFLKLTDREVESVLNAVNKEQGLSFCVKIVDSKKILILMRKNPFIWVQTEATTISEIPYLSITKVHWTGITIPGYFEAEANKELRTAYEKTFETGTLSSRYFDGLEIDENTFLIHSSVKK